MLEMDVTSVSHNHQNWMVQLFAMQKFGRISLDLKNERVAFSQHDIHVLGENTPKTKDTSSVERL